MGTLQKTGIPRQDMSFSTRDSQVIRVRLELTANGLKGLFYIALCIAIKEV